MLTISGDDLMRLHAEGVLKVGNALVRLAVVPEFKFVGGVTE